MVVVKSVVVVTSFVTCSCRAVVMVVVTMVVIAGVVATHTASGLKPDRPTVTVKMNLGAVSTTVVEEDTNTVVLVTLR